MFSSQIISQHELSDWFENDQDPHLLKCFLTDDNYSEIFADWLAYYKMDGHRAMVAITKKYFTHYYYMITFTLANMSNYQKAKSYIYRQHKRSSLSMVYYSVTEELTQNGVPHWHCAVKTKIPLKKDRFQQYYKNNKYGYVDVSRNNGSNLKSIIAYISKTNEPTILLDI